jgi:4-hydroxy-tetrahydrodipicolinate synthase
MAKTLWHGVYPAATTQFAADLSLDLPASSQDAERAGRGWC